MDLHTFRTIAEPFIALLTGIVATAYANAWLIQFMKSKVIPVPAEKYPRLTNWVTSAVLTGAGLFLTPINLVVHDVWGFIGLLMVLVVTTAIMYNHLVRDLKVE